MIENPCVGMKAVVRHLDSDRKRMVYFLGTVVAIGHYGERNVLIRVDGGHCFWPHHSNVFTVDEGLQLALQEAAEVAT